MRIAIGIELSRRDGGDANLVNQKPAKFEIAGAASNMGREWIVLWEFDRRHVGQNEVAALGVGVLSSISMWAVSGWI